MENTISTVHDCIEVTQAFLRFYVLATQYLDHRLRTHLPESLSHNKAYAHREQSRDALLRRISINRIVPDKVKKEIALAAFERYVLPDLLVKHRHIP